MAFAFGWDVGASVFGTSTWPVTHLMAGTLMSGLVSVVITLLIALFAGELVWRERDVRIDEIADTMPAPDWVNLLGKFLALTGVLVTLQCVFMAAGVLLQAIQGYYRFELGLYVRILFGMQLADYALVAALAMTIHVVANHKYVGHLIVVTYYVFALFAPRFGIAHNLLVFGSDPGWIYSDMNGFGPFLTPFVWFKLHWAAWVLAFAVVSRLLLVRGTEAGVATRLATAWKHFRDGTVVVTGAAAVLIVVTGGFIFYNTNVLNEYLTPIEAAARQAEYERRYKRFEGVAQPTRTATSARVEIYPDERAADLSGRYSLRNETSEPIDSIHVLVDRGLHARALRLDADAALALDDPFHGYRVYDLEEPLAPGDSIGLEFDLTFRPRGFRNREIRTQVVENGTYFDSSWFPVIGYDPGRELTDEATRRKHGLPVRVKPSASEPESRRPRHAELIDFDAVIGTAADQIAITLGTLVDEWTEDGRRYFRYRSQEPVSSWAPFLSARYDVTEARWNDVALRIFHHADHTFNLDRMVQSMTASLEYFSENFGPYPFDELRIVEFPRYASYARGHPHTIVFSEGNSFLTRVTDDGVDRPFFVTAHETAHQWWGGQVTGGRALGSALLTETLAQYSAMMVMEETFGPEHVRRLYDYQMEQYLTGRRRFTNRDVPLLDVDEQRNIAYGKGAVAMYTLRDHIGAERINKALRRYLQTYKDTGPPFPTAFDLYEELKAVTPDSQRVLLADLFEEVTLWNVRANEAIARPVGAGEYRVRLDVTTLKFRADSVGSETETAMDDLVDIGVFGEAEQVLYLEKHRLSSGQHTITLNVSGHPETAGVDPYGKLIQRDANDNVVPVEQLSASLK